MEVEVHGYQSLLPTIPTSMLDGRSFETMAALFAKTKESKKAKKPTKRLLEVTNTYKSSLEREAYVEPQIELPNLPSTSEQDVSAPVIREHILQAVRLPSCLLQLAAEHDYTIAELKLLVINECYIFLHGDSALQNLFKAVWQAPEISAYASRNLLHFYASSSSSIAWKPTPAHFYEALLALGCPEVMASNSSLAPNATAAAAIPLAQLQALRSLLQLLAGLCEQTTQGFPSFDLGRCQDMQRKLLLALALLHSDSKLVGFGWPELQAAFSAFINVIEEKNYGALLMQVATGLARDTRISAPARYEAVNALPLHSRRGLELRLAAGAELVRAVSLKARVSPPKRQNISTAYMATELLNQVQENVDAVVMGMADADELQDLEAMLRTTHAVLWSACKLHELQPQDNALRKAVDKMTAWILSCTRNLKNKLPQLKAENLTIVRLNLLVEEIADSYRQD